MATRLELYSNRDGDDKKKEKDVQFEHGYRLGFTDVNKVGCLGVPQGLWEFRPVSLQLLEPQGRAIYLALGLSPKVGRPGQVSVGAAGHGLSESECFGQGSGRCYTGSGRHKP